MDAHKQIRIDIVGYCSTFFKLKEVVIGPGHFDSQTLLFEQPGDIESNRKIDAFFVKAKNASCAGIFAAVAGIDYNGPRQSAGPSRGRG